MLWQKDIIVFDKLFQSHSFLFLFLFFWPPLNSDEHQERTESSRQRRKGGKDGIQNVGNWARSPKYPGSFLLGPKRGGMGTNKGGIQGKNARLSELEEPAPELEELWGTA